MSEYTQGHVKRDPVTGDVALRTHFPEDNPTLGRLAWLIGSQTMGSRHGVTSEVDSWDDLYVPEVQP